MKKHELIELLKKVPDDADVYVESDHGQTPEKVGSISLTIDKELPYYGDDVVFIPFNEFNHDAGHHVTGVLIG